MADFNINSEKGSVLMQQALKKYAKGDFEGGDNDRAEANRYFDLVSAEINSEEGKLTQLYGESRNFGIIYNVFEQSMEKLWETEQGKKTIKECYNLIKSDKVLNKQFKIYNMFEKAQNIDNVKEFVNEASGIVKPFDKKSIKESNEKFISFIRDNNIDEYVLIPEETENLYEAIEYIVLNKKNYNNVNDFIKAQNVIAEHIEKNQKKEINEDKITTKDFVKRIEEVDDEINENINEDERKLLDEFIFAKGNKKDIFEGYKKRTLMAIKEEMSKHEGEQKESLINIYEKINSNVYSEENLEENITNCAKMMEVYSTIKE